MQLHLEISGRTATINGQDYNMAAEAAVFSRNIRFNSVAAADGLALSINTGVLVGEGEEESVKGKDLLLIFSVFYSKETYWSCF